MKKFIKENLLLIILILAIVSNSIIHFRSPAYKKYNETSKQLTKKFQEYKEEVNTKILEKLLILTNFTTSVYSPHSPSSTVTRQNRLLNFLHSSTNLPALQFDNYFVYRNRPFVQQGFQYYTIGDKYLGFPILNITPQFVQIGFSYFPIGTQRKVSNNDGNVNY